MSVAVLIEWLGSGGQPVSQEKAEARAAVCVACPENRPGEWWLQDLWDEIKNNIARSVRSHIEVKNNLQLKLTVEEQLGTCRVCGCNLRTLPWVPAEVIKSRTPAAEIKDYPGVCWKRIELEA